MNLSSPFRRILGSTLCVRTVPLVILGLNAAAYVNLSNGTPICFDDCVTYTVLMGRPSFRDYLDTAATMFRSWGVPVFFSLFGKYTLANASSIAFTQTLLLHGAWLLFAWAVSTRFEGWLARATFLLTAASMYAHQYFVFNRYLLSDSLGMSTALWFLATAVALDRLAARAGRLAAFALLVLTALLAAGTRDANMGLVAVGGLYVAIAHWRALGFAHLVAVALALSLVLSRQVEDSRRRQEVNIENVLAGFVLPHEPVRRYFVARGMSPALAQVGSTFPPQPWCAADIARVIEGRRTIEAHRSDYDLGKELRRASRVWARWLVTHPGYVLSQGYDDVECILGQSLQHAPQLAEPTRDAPWTRPGEPVVPIQHAAPRVAPSDLVPVRARLWITLSLALVLAVAWWRGRAGYALAALFLVGAGLSNAVAGYFADVWAPGEMVRHALVGAVVFDVGFLVSIVAAAAMAIEWRAARAREVAPETQLTSSAG